MPLLHMNAGALEADPTIRREELWSVIGRLLPAASKLASLLPKQPTIDPSFPILQTASATLWASDVVAAQDLLRELLGAEPVDLNTALRQENARLLVVVAEKEAALAAARSRLEVLEAGPVPTAPLTHEGAQAGPAGMKGLGP